MKPKKNLFQPLQEIEMPDFRPQMGANPYPQLGHMGQMGQMGQMYQQQGQPQFPQMGGQPTFQQPVQLTQPQPAGVQVPPMTPAQQTGPSIPGMLPLEQSYIENILRLNRGKVATVYMTFENNPQWNAKVFRGEIEAAGRDHIILSDRKTGTRYLLLMVYLDYITFDEPIVYDYPYSMASYTPR
ncbi:spore coat protein [Bacillus glycinifermentans]|uniref:Spore coat protein GerQ n=1 Tax=Bacillus glycinifermentans TaxID=1664069 RepID=A0A0J6EQX9_9BACI|nr:spore coat protein GerQ [Bacillus glycinifermentans]ATH93626.1 spore coat protein GerQ [Bacillus glycinifermentans]KMM59179.1 spore coat protein [Bacillus glycinifermentans]KRT90200.1 spore coat protein GerQ [Bacillus glycinifermentans]MEC0483887.1 spore coat protein GerQ [Bacillus glycinifermentans]MEC0496383.1 spore coat protein GerQ [Bacillus glycinifermentans]